MSNELVLDQDAKLALKVLLIYAKRSFEKEKHPDEIIGMLLSADGSGKYKENYESIEKAIEYIESILE